MRRTLDKISNKINLLKILVSDGQLPFLKMLELIVIKWVEHLTCFPCAPWRGKVGTAVSLSAVQSLKLSTVERGREWDG